MVDLGSLLLKKRETSVDIITSNLKNNRIWNVADYDGKNIPFDDNHFDIVFSSNTLEHIPHVREFQKEIRRVLKLDGVVIHILPSSSWRFWSNITEVLKSWRLPAVHGEHARNACTEIYYFSSRVWSTLFRETGWSVKTIEPVGLFYTGSSIMDTRLNISIRRKLSFILGSACNVFILKNDKA